MKRQISFLACAVIVFSMNNNSFSAEAAKPSAQSSDVQQLNSQIQGQLKQIQATQEKQMQDLNNNIQKQIKQMQTELQNQIEAVNTQTQAKIKKMQTDLQAEIKQVQDSVSKAKG